MRSNPVYKKLKKIALEGDYTIEQVTNASKGQIESLVGHELTVNFYSSLKTCVLQDLQEKLDGQAVAAFKDKVKAYLDQYYPDYKFERGRDRDKPFITIWLEGKP